MGGKDIKKESMREGGIAGRNEGARKRKGRRGEIRD